VRNSIKKVIGEGVEFKGFAKRASQWVMTCIKRAEEYGGLCAPEFMPS
jgi:hypothetical protein